MKSCDKLKSCLMGIDSDRTHCTILQDKKTIKTIKISCFDTCTADHKDLLLTQTFYANCSSYTMILNVYHHCITIIYQILTSLHKYSKCTSSKVQLLDLLLSSLLHVTVQCTSVVLQTADTSDHSQVFHDGQALALLDALSVHVHTP